MKERYTTIKYKRGDDPSRSRRPPGVILAPGRMHTFSIHRLYCVANKVQVRHVDCAPIPRYNTPVSSPLPEQVKACMTVLTGVCPCGLDAGDLADSWPPESHGMYAGKTDALADHPRWDLQVSHAIGPLDRH